MTTVEVLGYVAQFLFVSASFSQARKCYIEGHATGLSWGLLLQLIVGFGIMFYYVPIVIGWDVVLLSGYLGQFVCILFMVRYKIFPRIPLKTLVDDPRIAAAQMVAESDIHNEEWVWSESLGQYVDANKEKK